MHAPKDISPARHPTTNMSRARRADHMPCGTARCQPAALQHQQGRVPRRPGPMTCSYDGDGREREVEQLVRVFRDWLRSSCFTTCGSLGYPRHSRRSQIDALCSRLRAFGAITNRPICVNTGARASCEAARRRSARSLMIMQVRGRSAAARGERATCRRSSKRLRARSGCRRPGRRHGPAACRRGPSTPLEMSRSY